MKTNAFRCAIAVMTVLLAFAGCVPGQPPEPKPAEPAPPAAVPTESAAAPRETVTPRPAPETPDAPASMEPDLTAPGEEETHYASIHVPSIELAQTEGVGAAVRPLPEARGPGYEVKGSYDLEGTIVPALDAEGQWVFKGQITFPTGGYQLGEPWTQQQMGPEGVDQIIIMLPMSLPAKDAMLTQALDRRAIDYRFAGSPKAQFVVMFTLL